MELIHIHQCLSDETRQRILNLLMQGPLCVCHLQEVLGHEQVRVSKHLAYLRARRVVEAQRHQSWMIYSLPKKPSPELTENLKCLQACTKALPVFKKDLRQLSALKPKGGWLADAGCCAPS